MTTYSVSQLPTEVFAPTFEVSYEVAPPAYDNPYFPEYVARLGYAIASLVDYAETLSDNEIEADLSEESTLVIVRETSENDLSGFPYEIEVTYPAGALPATVTRIVRRGETGPGELSLEI